MSEVKKNTLFDVTNYNFTGNQYGNYKKSVAETDEILMQNVKDGNLIQMSVLFERYHLRLYNFFFRLTFDMDASQDLTQNLFYRMIKYRNSYKSEYPFKSWIFEIARNLHADYCKEEKRSGSIFMKTDKYPMEPSDETDGYHEEDYDRLDKAFSSLSDDQKEIIILSRYQGLKYEEISVITKQSVAAIKVAMYRAIKQLRGVYFKQT